MNAEDFYRQHPRLARDLDRALYAAQFEIGREHRPRPVWTGSMVATAVSAGFWCGIWTAGAVWVAVSPVSGWWLLLPLLLLVATVGAARDEITKARYRHAVRPRPPRIGGDR